MVGHHISSPQNSWVREILRLRAGRGSRDLILLEGPHLVAEALARGLRLRKVLITAAWRRRPEAASLLARLAAVVAPPGEIDEKLLPRLADADSPQGILALAEAPDLSAERLPSVPGGCYLFAEAVQDPGNVGALARSAEAAGAAALVLGAGAAHPHQPRALRASAGALLRLAVARPLTAGQCQAILEPLDPCWILLDPHRGESLYDADLGGTVILALGAEGAGLSSALDGLPRSRRVRIPLAATVESLNVTVAAAVVLFERRRRELRS